MKTLTNGRKLISLPELVYISFFSRLPIVTGLLLLPAIGLYFSGIDQSLLYFEPGKIIDGELWRMVSGHFTHSDANHLFWNCLGLVVLGGIIERRSRRLLLCSVATGLVSVSLLLLSPLSTLDIYCGLSGVLNSLLIVALWSEWRSERQRIYPAVGLLAFSKILLELSLGQSLFADLSWPPYPLAHLVGFAGGLLLISRRLIRE